MPTRAARQRQRATAGAGRPGLVAQDARQLLGGTTSPPKDWFYLLAQCDWDGNRAVDATYWQRSDLTELGHDNDGR